ncbi:MAG TPA: hypothetical protein PLT64_05255 [Syntrophales bacterium]|nr:hypothetical protein [Syntrophales bacterium]HOL59260.1 hypothetical protein [Syntrophales bacterium]HPO35310.1 hypothetical protein [Syntrophales bacterium]
MEEKLPPSLVRQMQERLERKLREKEIEVIEYWQGQIGKILGMKPEGIGPLQLQVKKVYDMMSTRIQVLKRGER